MWHRAVAPGSVKRWWAALGDGGWQPVGNSWWWRTRHWAMGKDSLGRQRLGPGHLRVVGWPVGVWGD
ncbi:hypothetical protein E2562_022203 [Oryza meyeriana var. granulata]|uniref:Uncharacterized protein n=1 Tax=Oryza meyeriana var. granulata TaxID=110450 RepID=A0A6G1DLV4_9ORYZ|nr:hypothetical protein E2562_022203 [Oryza meyeriana var. granulata]